jgi:hypothetical protein
MGIINFIIGISMLTLGHRLFWLFVGCMGFAAGFYYTPQIWTIHSDLILLVIAVTGGIVGAILAILFQKVAIVLAGFAAGSFIAVNLMDLLGLQLGQFIWLPHIIGGILGAVLLFFLFDWALILLSCFAGASLIVQTIDFSPLLEKGLFTGLVILGIVFQLKIKAQEQTEGS